MNRSEYVNYVTFRRSEIDNYYDNKNWEKTSRGIGYYLFGDRFEPDLKHSKFMELFPKLLEPMDHSNKEFLISLYEYVYKK
jgi:hypothetical protein